MHSGLPPFSHPVIGSNLNKFNTSLLQEGQGKCAKALHSLALLQEFTEVSRKSNEIIHSNKDKETH